MEFGYWKIRGLGSVFRMVFEYKQASYVDKQYCTPDDWFKDRKPAIKALNPLANLPYLVDGDTCVCQTNAVLYYLGEKYGLNGRTFEQKLVNQQLLAEIYDLRNSLIELCYPSHHITRSKEEFKEKAPKHIDAALFAKFEAILKKTGATWFVLEGGPAVADFHIWEMLDQHKILAEQLGAGDIFANIPNCKAFYDAFRTLPTLQKYFSSEDYKLPINYEPDGAYFW